jgi:hypothetical protein
MSGTFLVSSAINTKFGVFDSLNRIRQTLDTISSIRRSVNNVKIILLEMAAIPLTEEQKLIFRPVVDEIIEFHSNPEVQSIYKDKNWDIVKNVTEVTCFALALESLITDSKLSQSDRVYKISGRYSLNEKFNHSFHYSCEKIIVSKRRRSQFPFVLTGGIRYQYMSRLWSWPTILSPTILKVYKEGLIYIKNQIGRGGYCDIEHMLYEFLPEYQVLPVEFIGIEGMLGPNGSYVED